MSEPSRSHEVASEYERILPLAATRAERVAAILLALGALFILYLARGLEPDARGYGTHERLGLKPCSFKVYTGYPCMTCGMTTSFSHMAHFQVADAVRVQPAGALLFVLAVLFVPAALWSVVRGRSLIAWLEHSAARWSGVALLVILAGSWIYTAIRFGG